MRLSRTLPHDFGFTDEHQMLQSEARRVLAERFGRATLRRWIEGGGEHDAELYQALAELGWCGLTIEERYGGAGLGYSHLAVLAEEIGRALLPAPCLASITAAEAIALAGDDAMKVRWLPAIADGSKLATAAVDSRTGVVAAQTADLFVVDQTLAERDAVTIEPDAGLDVTKPTATVKLTGQGTTQRTTLKQSEAFQTRALLIAAAEATGAAEAVLVMTRDYAIERHQFGKPIGAFQAVSHPIVDMMIGIENARSLTYACAAALDSDNGDAKVLSRMAKAAASDALSFAVAKGVQLHGGFGFTWDCDVHFYFRRSLYERAALGDPTDHRAWLGEYLLAEES
ncbi:acyl-CoA/acyl-ACP dehydrogenase [Desulfobulbus sp. AH-315-M07]|nr:acyl-CoA/acyl-ACP dehydrogenase [Desulfobulbus sp. AH-315-M07]